MYLIKVGKSQLLVDNFSFELSTLVSNKHIHSCNADGVKMLVECGFSSADILQGLNENGKFECADFNIYKV